MEQLKPSVSVSRLIIGGARVGDKIGVRTGLRIGLGVGVDVVVVGVVADADGSGWFTKDFSQHSKMSKEALGSRQSIVRNSTG